MQILGLFSFSSIHFFFNISSIHWGALSQNYLVWTSKSRVNNRNEIDCYLTLSVSNFETNPKIDRSKWWPYFVSRCRNLVSSIRYQNQAMDGSSPTGVEISLWSLKCGHGSLSTNLHSFIPAQMDQVIENGPKWILYVNRKNNYNVFICHSLSCSIIRGNRL